jgi:(p)ppGpp synthase/HD superfamily hydrolase
MYMIERLTNTGLVTVAFEIAQEAHDGQLYGGRPYINHPLEVAHLALDLGYPEEVQAGCLMHDVVEDSDITFEDLEARGVPLVVVDGVEAVTYRRDIDNGGKILKARAHILGHVIKFCDSSRNFATTVNDPESLGQEKALTWAIDYAAKLGELQPGLPTPLEIIEYLRSTQ